MIDISREGLADYIYDWFGHITGGDSFLHIGYSDALKIVDELDKNPHKFIICQASTRIIECYISDYEAAAELLPDNVHWTRENLEKRYYVFDIRPGLVVVVDKKKVEYFESLPDENNKKQDETVS